MLRRPAAPVLAVAALAAAWAATGPHTADMAAHAFRAWLWEAEGFTVWNNQWYGGHHVPGYSLLFPPLAALLGPWVAVAAAGAFAAATLALLLRECHLKHLFGASDDTHRAAGWLAASGVAANVIVGRGPFVLGVAFGALALLLLLRGRGALAALAAAAATAASPVAGLFLALALAAVLAARATDTARASKATPSTPGSRAAAEAALAAPAAALGAIVLTGAAMTLPFPEGGAERFVATAFWPMFALAVAAFALVDPRHRTLRLAAAGYALLLVAAFLLETPVGQNATRLAALAGPPVLILAGRGPRLAIVASAAALSYLAWLPAVRAIDEQRGDPSTQAAFHEPLLDFLQAQASPGDRVEIPLTRNHWEAVHVAKRRAIARGWERQLDLKYNALFYGDRPLTPQGYASWLRSEQIRWIALPDAPLDFSARDEAELLRSRPPFLRFRARLENWTVFENRSVGPSPITALTPSSITTRHAGVLPYRFTRYWRMAGRAACVRRGPRDRIEIASRRPGLLRIEARLRGPVCR